VGIKAENFETDTIKFDEFYTGWTHEELDPASWLSWKRRTTPQTPLKACSQISLYA
jgi:hypothetical protein